MLFRAFPPETRTLLGAPLVLGPGFCAVIPFLAGATAGEYGLGAAVISVVLGAVAGPVVGAALLGRGPDAALSAGPVVFSALTVLRWWGQHCSRSRTATSRADPTGRPHRAGAPGHRRVPECLPNRQFVVFCALTSVNLLVCNQRYFAVPVELEFRALDPGWLGGWFLLASVLTLTLHRPVAATARPIGPGPTSGGGSVPLGAAFTVLATTAVHPGGSPAPPPCRGCCPSAGRRRSSLHP